MEPKILTLVRLPSGQEFCPEWIIWLEPEVGSNPKDKMMTISFAAPDEDGIYRRTLIGPDYDAFMRWHDKYVEVIDLGG